MQVLLLRVLTLMLGGWLVMTPANAGEKFVTFSLIGDGASQLAAFNGKVTGGSQSLFGSYTDIEIGSNTRASAGIQAMIASARQATAKNGIARLASVDQGLASLGIDYGGKGGKKGRGEVAGSFTNISDIAAFGSNAQVASTSLGTIDLELKLKNNDLRRAATVRHQTVQTAASSGIESGFSTRQLVDVRRFVTSK